MHHVCFQRRPSLNEAGCPRFERRSETEPAEGLADSQPPSHLLWDKNSLERQAGIAQTILSLLPRLSSPGQPHQTPCMRPRSQVRMKPVQKPSVQAAKLGLDTSVSQVTPVSWACILTTPVFFPKRTGSIRPVLVVFLFIGYARRK